MTKAEKINYCFAEIDFEITTCLRQYKDIIPINICLNSFDKAKIYFAGEREVQGAMKVLTGMSVDAYVKRRYLMLFYKEMMTWSEYNNNIIKAKLGPSYQRKLKDVFNMTPKALFDDKDHNHYEEPLSWESMSADSQQFISGEEHDRADYNKYHNYDNDIISADLCDIYKLNYIEEGLAKELSIKYNLSIQDVFGYISSYLWRYTSSNNPEDESRDNSLIKDLKSEDVIYMYFKCHLSHYEIRHILYKKKKNQLVKNITCYSPQELKTEINNDINYHDFIDDFIAEYDYEIYDDLSEITSNLYDENDYFDFCYNTYLDTLDAYNCGYISDDDIVSFNDLLYSNETEEEYLYSREMEQLEFALSKKNQEQKRKRNRVEKRMIRLLSKNNIPIELKRILSADYSNIKEVPENIREKLTEFEKKQLRWKDLTPSEVCIDIKIRDLLLKYDLQGEIRQIHCEEGLGEARKEVKVRHLFEPKYDDKEDVTRCRNIDDFVGLSSGLLLDGYNIDEQILLEDTKIRDPIYIYIASKKLGMNFTDALSLFLERNDEKNKTSEKMLNLKYEIRELRILYW